MSNSNGASGNPAEADEWWLAPLLAQGGDATYIREMFACGQDDMLGLLHGIHRDASGVITTDAGYGANGAVVAAAPKKIKAARPKTPTREEAEAYRLAALTSEERLRRKARRAADEAEEYEAKAAAPALIADYAAANVMSLSQLRDLPRSPFLIEGWIPMHASCRLFGPSGTYKSFIEIDRMCRLALGRDWYGYPVAPSQDGHRVAWVAAEGAEDLWERIAGWCTHHELTPEELDRLERNLILHPTPVQVMNDQQWFTFAALCLARGVSYVVLDTQAKVTVGVEENSATAMGTVLHRVEGLAKHRDTDGHPDGPAVMLVHHSGYEGTRSRGSSGVFAGVDVEIEVSSPGQGRVELHHDKIKRRVKLGEHHLKLVTAEYEPGATTLVLANLDGTDKAGTKLDALQAAHDRLLCGLTSVREQVAYVLRATFYANKAGASRTEVRNVVNDLRAKADPPQKELVARASTFHDAWNDLIATGHAEPVGVARIRITPTGCEHYGWSGPDDDGVYSALRVATAGHPEGLSEPAISVGRRSG